MKMAGGKMPIRPLCLYAYGTAIRLKKAPRPSASPSPEEAPQNA
jgi:hypothetical protein